MRKVAGMLPIHDLGLACSSVWPCAKGVAHACAYDTLQVLRAIPCISDWTCTSGRASLLVHALGMCCRPASGQDSLGSLTLGLVHQPKLYAAKSIGQTSIYAGICSPCSQQVPLLPSIQHAIRFCMWLQV